MATAKRIPQDKKRVETQMYREYSLLAQVKEKGLLVKTEVFKTESEWVPTVEYVSQPDAIQATLTSEEARCVVNALTYSTNSRAKGVILALTGAMQAVLSVGASPNQGSAAPTGQDSKTSTPVAFGGLVNTVPTSASARAAQQAQQDAYKRRYTAGSWDLR